MLLKDFDFVLPDSLIAQAPLERRSSSKLLSLDKKMGVTGHFVFSDLPELLAPDDLIIFNDTRVIPARIYVHRTTGGKIEVLVERILSDNEVLAQVRKSKKLSVGDRLFISDDIFFEVMAFRNALIELRLSAEDSLSAVLHKFGKVPLPPYIKREARVSDETDYQTIFARRDGAVAAPTAGLHFDQELMTKLLARGVRIAYVTLHVGLGTFQPIRTERIVDHRMHSEYIEVSSEVCRLIVDTKKLGRKVIAVGTTTLRALESAYLNGQPRSYYGETDIFIHGKYNFLSSDVLITNFHLPKTTLLMLVCSFGGYENVMHAYAEAIENSYRFYSYGDAMIIN